MPSKNYADLLSATLSRRQILKGGSAAALATLLGACGAPAAPTAAPTATALPAPSGSAQALDALIAAAREEGSLTSMTLDHDWLNFGAVIDTYKTTFGMQMNELDPTAAAGQAVAAVRQDKLGQGPGLDFLDVGFAFIRELQQEQLLQPYKVATWDSIPDALKDPAGYWYGAYYGVLAFAVNTDVVAEVPRDWADLLNPRYHQQVALNRDPRTGTVGILSVYAAALGATQRLDQPAAGLEFFAQLHQVGNLLPHIGLQADLLSGKTPILLTWDFLATGFKEQAKAQGGPAIAVVVPPSGVLGGVYAEGISAFAPHVNAAKLWMEFVYSDVGQLLWLKGYGHPIRYHDLVQRKVIPPELAAILPPAEVYANAAFPSLLQLETAQKLIAEQWDAVVKLDIQSD